MEVIYLIFITMFNLKQPPKKERADQTTKMLENLDKQGIKMHVYWTLGRYDGVAINEAPTEKDAMKAILTFQNLVATETMWLFLGKKRLDSCKSEVEQSSLFLFVN
jgi:uncharacterized protein with GYD domain